MLRQGALDAALRKALHGQGSMPVADPESLGIAVFSGSLRVFLCDRGLMPASEGLSRPEEILRSECLDTNWFQSLFEAKQLIEAWRQECNVSHPHMALATGRQLKQNQAEN